VANNHQNRTPLGNPLMNLARLSWVVNLCLTVLAPFPVRQNTGTAKKTRQTRYARPHIVALEMTSFTLPHYRKNLTTPNLLCSQSYRVRIVANRRVNWEMFSHKTGIMSPVKLN